MTKTQLKAAAYDCLSKIQFLQNQLAQINAEIAKPDDVVADENPAE